MTDNLLVQQKLRNRMQDLYNREATNKLSIYGGEPGTRGAPTMKQLEFHNAGSAGDTRFRLLMAGNQSGKSWAGAMEWAMHMTGEYPSWWKGKRFGRPVRFWASGDTSETTRDNPQRLLLGQDNVWGTGTIPADKLVGTPTMARTIPNAVDKFGVKHKSGGVSTCSYKSYEKGRKKWQGETLDGIWYDEEPPWDIWVEGQTRLNRRKGIAIITFTPLLGMSKVVTMFLRPDKDDKGVRLRQLIQMDLDDATFYSSEDKEDIVDQYEESEREARIHGNPAIGSGLIYPFMSDNLKVEPFSIPDWYRLIDGMDFGWEHPTTWVRLAYDPERDIIYLVDVYKERKTTYAEHASAIRKKGNIAPIAWPHDGMKSDGRDGFTTAQNYEKEGLRMMAESARYNDETGGSQPREPIIGALYQRMKTGTFKVFDIPHIMQPFWDEKNSYHRKDGKVVDYNDDVISAIHYAVMMLRFAEAPYEIDKAMVNAKRAANYNPLELHGDLNNASLRPILR
jgi:phage terminase large subunit-like protein